MAGTTTTTLAAAAESARKVADRFHLPGWAYGLLVILVVFAAVAKQAEPVANLGGKLIGFVGNRRRKGRLPEKALLTRKNFANHVKTQVQRINEQEDWTDLRFAELETELEIAQRQRRFLPRARQEQGETLRRMPSLASALEATDEKLVILEGEPGSGKSLALRHIAEHMAADAERSTANDCKIPLYANLREFRTNGPVTAQALTAFVRASINRQSLSHIDKYLDANFDDGLDAGTWLFLLDSFDELPELLSATDAGGVLSDYVEAIYDFAHGMSACRTLVASREFRGPKTDRWRRFRLLPLSRPRQEELVRKKFLDEEDENILIRGLPDAPEAIRRAAENPLFLSLLCEHARDEHSFPANTHAVFAGYIDRRLETDRSLLTERFGISPEQVRLVAENVAFTIAATSGLGLKPERRSLREAVGRMGFAIDDLLDRGLNALQSIHLAQSGDRLGAGEQGTFEFAHRRFQEYFATCIVLRERERVSPHELLTDGAWRETAAAIMQTQSRELAEPLIHEAQDLLASAVAAMTETFGVADDDLHVSADARWFNWPPGSLHVLDLMNAAFGGRPAELPAELRSAAGALVEVAAERGQRHDRNWALQFAGIVEPEVLVSLIRLAFQSRSPWLREIVFRQVGQLQEIPPDIAREIRLVLVSMSVGGRLRRERRSVQAQLRRLSSPDEYLDVARLLAGVTVVDWGIALVVALVGLQSLTRAGFLALVVKLVVSSSTAYVIRDELADGVSRFVRWRSIGSLRRARRVDKQAQDAGSSPGVVPRAVKAVDWQGTTMLGVAILVRYALVATLVGAVINSASGHTVTLAVLASYYVLWMPSALFLGVEGRWLEPLLLRFLAPLYAVGAGLRFVVRILVGEARAGRIRTEIIGAAVGVGFLALLLLSLNAGMKRYPDVAALLFAPVLLAFLGNALFGLVRKLRLARSDRRLNASYRPDMVDGAVDSMLGTLVRLRTTGGMLRFLRGVRDSRVFETAPGIVVAVGDLVRAAERVKAVDYLGGLVVPGDLDVGQFESPEMRAWVGDDLVACVGTLALLDEYCLDELARMIAGSGPSVGVGSW